MWISRFERYRQASELNRKDDTLQINNLIYAMVPWIPEVPRNTEKRDL